MTAFAYSGIMQRTPCLLRSQALLLDAACRRG
jgi:hypothetical protein